MATKIDGVNKQSCELASKLVKKEDGVILSIQNGLGASGRISEFISEGNVMLGIAKNVGASMVKPGHAKHESMNMITIGNFRSSKTGEAEIVKLEKVVNMWKTAGFTAQCHPNIEIAIWEKLICNVYVSGVCALTEFTVGEMIDNDYSERIAMKCAEEADRIAKLKGLKMCYGDDLKGYLKKFTSTVRKATPSLAQDHGLKRKGEIMAINGAVVIEGEKHGLDMAYNRVVSDLVRAREEGFGKK